MLLAASLFPFFFDFFPFCDFPFDTFDFPFAAFDFPFDAFFPCLYLKEASVFLLDFLPDISFAAFTTVFCFLPLEKLSTPPFEP